MSTWIKNTDKEAIISGTKKAIIIPKTCLFVGLTSLTSSNKPGIPPSIKPANKAAIEKGIISISFFTANNPPTKPKAPPKAIGSKNLIDFLNSLKILEIALNIFL